MKSTTITLANCKIPDSGWRPGGVLPATFADCLAGAPAFARWQLLGFALLLGMVAACRSKFTGPDEKGIYVLHNSRARIQNQNTFFAAERAWLKKRRSHAGVDPGQKLTGLAFSGGGIRSNAFQTGLLSGLHSTGILKNIDYISGVSGGSWATGAYRARASNDSVYFNNLDQAVCKPNEDSQSIPELRVLMSGYGSIASGLSLTELIKSHGKSSLIASLWRKMVLSNFLSDSDVTIFSVRYRHPGRPIPIISGTHSADLDITSLPENLDAHFATSYPFEFSPFSTGTIVDCKTAPACKELNESEGAMIDLEKNPGAAPALSLAMSVSSAVLPPIKIFSILRLRVLEWNHELPVSSSGPKIRRNYRLTDGGHSENLGVLPLLERGVEVILISDAGEDAGYSFSNLDMLKKQASSLLGVTISVKGIDEFSRNSSAVLEGAARIKKFIFRSRIADIVYVKLKKSEEFQQELRQNCPHIASYLARDTIFPFHPTFSSGYSDEAIRAYYLLGRWTGKQHAAQLLKEQLDLD